MTTKPEDAKPRIYFTPHPIFCQDCGERFHEEPGTEMFDCSTKQGPWGCFCKDCWPKVRRHDTLGLGKGQRYALEAAPNGQLRFFCVEGL